MTSLHVICDSGPPPQSKILATPMIAEKETKMLELENLFIQYVGECCLYEYGPEKWIKPHLKVLLRKFLTLGLK